ncbi:AI-2E family transporter [Candidatus Gottesmanbacteria bacterium]|nr:AI-2E family transporter [Candidatus Gottesmanbacteria bacterium]
MKITPKIVVSFILALSTLIFLYFMRSLLGPFILAAVFAYLFNPLVTFLNKKIKLPKTLSVVVIYTIVIGAIVLMSAKIGIQLTKEYKELISQSKLTILFLNGLNALPSPFSEWLRDAIGGLNLDSLFISGKIWPYFAGALSRMENLFIFLIAGFYFLKDGDKATEKIYSYFSHTDQVEIAIVIRKINTVLNNYLRGQVFLIILMATLTWFGLSYLQVKYALIIAIFTGFAEIVPFVGPFTAGGVAVLVAMLDGISFSGLPPLFEGAVVASMYLIFREVEDIFIIPQVIGHATKLHPLAVLFAVLAGGHFWGVLGIKASEGKPRGLVKDTEHFSLPFHLYPAKSG